MNSFPRPKPRIDIARVVASAAAAATAAGVGSPMRNAATAAAAVAAGVTEDMAVDQNNNKLDETVRMIKLISYYNEMIIIFSFANQTSSLASHLPDVPTHAIVQQQPHESIAPVAAGDENTPLAQLAQATPPPPPPLLLELPTTTDIVAKLSTRRSLLALLLDDLRLYKERALTVAQRQQQQQQRSIDVQLRVGRRAHDDHIAVRLRCFELVLSSALHAAGTAATAGAPSTTTTPSPAIAALRVTRDQVDQLYDAIILDAITPGERAMAFRFLKVARAVFGDSLLQQHVLARLCALDARSMSDEALQCFVQIGKHRDA